MEKWLEICKNTIPQGTYSLEVKCGEQDGIVVKLESFEYSINIDFGSVSAIRVLDEGLALQRVAKESGLERYKKDNFVNVIYKCQDGEFGNTIKNMCGELYEILKFQHYIIVSLNYVVEVVTQWDPQIVVTTKCQHL